MYEARLAAIGAAIRAGEARYSTHTIIQMADRGIERAALEVALTEGDVEVIEDYPGDPRGASRLVPTWINGRALHVTISFPPAPTIITVY